MPYPDHLLPQQHFKIIDDDLSEYYVLRATDTKDIFDENGRVITSCVCSPRTNCEDLSVNLLGVFRHLDVRYQIESNGEYYHADWEVGEQVEPPSDQDYSINENKGCFYIGLGEINNLSIPYKNGATGDEYILHCRPFHRPTNCNFWHLELRWYNDHGYIKGQQGNWKKRILTNIRNLISEFGLDIPPFEPRITEGVYTN